MFSQFISRSVTFSIAAVLVASSAMAQTVAPVVGQKDRSASPVVYNEIRSAQNPPASLVPPRSYVIGRSGLTFGTRTAALLGVEFGGQVAPALQAYGSVDWHRDISPSFVEDLSELISDLTGVDVNYRFPAFIGVGGIKVIAPRGAVRPYGLGGFGFGRVNGVVEVEGDDVTDLLDELGYLDRDDVNFNKMLFEVGAGIAASHGRLYVDVGYRFRKFLQTGEPINMSGLYAGVGVGF